MAGSAGESLWQPSNLTGKTGAHSLTPRESMMKSSDRSPSVLVDRSSKSSKLEKENTGLETLRSCVLFVFSDQLLWSVLVVDGALLMSSSSRMILAEPRVAPMWR